MRQHIRSRSRYAVLSAAAALATCLALAGCGDSGSLDTDAPDPETVEAPELIASWTEDDRRVDLPPPEQLPADPVDTEQERAELLDVLPPAEEVADANLEEVLLIVGSYADCARDGRIVGTGEDARFESFVLPEQKDVRCVRAPYTIEVWQVPRSDPD